MKLIVTTIKVIRSIHRNIPVYKVAPKLKAIRNGLPRPGYLVGVFSLVVNATQGMSTSTKLIQSMKNLQHIFCRLDFNALE